MTVLVVTINDPSPAFEHKSAEVSYMRRVLETIAEELSRSQGNVTSSSIVGHSASGAPNTSLGSWTYTPTATKA
ncbi:MAG TPA: hypothetical protein VK825_01065 [Xanthobacteraceae bacterium]|jgi:hypothetical protein|nr:hypothetical protein [Xanthobacteraceae bacterium]